MEMVLYILASRFKRWGMGQMEEQQNTPTWWRRFDRACFATPRDRRNMHRFTLRLVVWMVLFLASSFWLEDPKSTQGVLEAAIAFVPSVAFGWSLLAFGRYLREADELARRIQYEAIAFAFGIGMLAMLGYPMFEVFGLPRLEPVLAAGGLSIVWALASVANAQRYA